MIHRGARKITLSKVRGLAFSLIFAVSHAAFPQQITTVGNATRVEHQGRTFEVETGSVYEVTQAGRIKLLELYDPNFLANNYTSGSGQISRIVPGYGNFPVKTDLVDSFETANTIHDLIGPTATFTSMTMLGPASPTVADYVELRSRILRRETDFIDSRIDPTIERSHNGQKSLRFSTPAAQSEPDLLKASLDTELVHFAKNDHFWFTGWFYLESGQPYSILDLESTYMVEAPGIRVMLDDQLRPSVQLKFADKPSFNMDPLDDFTFPEWKWVEVKLHVYLRDSEDGQVELWVDGTKRIDQLGRTLTMFDAVYNSLQVGITASPPDVDTVLYLDDFKLGE